MKKTIIKMTCAAILSLCLGLAALPAVADMMLMPVRVTFKDGDRMKTLSVFNTAKTQGLYRIELINKKQVKEGGFVDLKPEEKPQYDMAEMLVYSPRQISLDAQGKQAIRLSLRRPAELPDGEYRTYARLTRVAKDKTDRDAGIKPGTAKAQVGINVGFAVPIVLRKGKYDTTAKLGNPQMMPVNPKSKDKRQRLKVTISRTGKFSAMGRLEVMWQPPGGGEEVKVGELNGVNIYPELTLREAEIPMQSAGVAGGKLKITYYGDDADKGVVFDQILMPL